MLGSVHAVTETIRVIIASKTGSQLAGFAAIAAHIIWVAGTWKIVPTLEDDLKRIEEYALPLENASSIKGYIIHSIISKLLITNVDHWPGRTTMILVKNNLEFWFRKKVDSSPICAALRSNNDQEREGAASSIRSNWRFLPPTWL